MSRIICALLAINLVLLAKEPVKQPLISTETINNGNLAYPPSHAYIDLLQRSAYLFTPETKNYLQRSQALVFHAMTPYYTVQRNNTSCSLATAVMLLNGVKAIQAHTHLDTPSTQNEVLETVKDPFWDSATADDGPGVSLDEFGQLLEKMFAAYKVENVAVEVVHVEDKSEKTRQQIHNDLMSLSNEERVTTLLALNFDDRCYINSTEDVGHVSPVGGYDPHSGLVLVLDVDREWTGPYWITEETLLNGLNTLSAVGDASQPKHRGYVRIRLNP